MADTHVFKPHGNPQRHPMCVQCGRSQYHPVHEAKLKREPPLQRLFRRWKDWRIYG